MNVLVIDVGTSSMRGILFEHQGKCLTEKQEFYQATYLENSWVEQNPADWYEQSIDGLKELLAECDKSRVAGSSWGGQKLRIWERRLMQFPLLHSVLL